VSEDRAGLSLNVRPNSYTNTADRFNRCRFWLSGQNGSGGTQRHHVSEPVGGRSDAADSDTNRHIGNISGTAGAVPLPSSTFSRSSRRQQSTSQERSLFCPGSYVKLRRGQPTPEAHLAGRRRRSQEAESYVETKERPREAKISLWTQCCLTELELASPEAVEIRCFRPKNGVSDS